MFSFGPTQNSSLCGNNKTNNSNTSNTTNPVFGNIISANNGNNGLLIGINNNNLNNVCGGNNGNKNTSIFEINSSSLMRNNNNNTQTNIPLFGNCNNQNSNVFTNENNNNQQNNNITNTMNNNINKVYDNLIGEASNDVIDAVVNQKDIMTFLNELKEKYYEDNNQLLNGFGKYLNKKKASYEISYNSYYDSKYSIKSYSSYKPSTVVKNIEYYKKKYSTDEKKKKDMKSKYSSLVNSEKSSRINSSKSLIDNNSKIEKSIKISEDDYLYQKHLLGLDEIRNMNFKPFHYDWMSKSSPKKMNNKENEDLNIINNKKIKSISSKKNTINNNISLEINYNIPDGTNESFIIESINVLNSIQNLKNLITDKINVILKNNYFDYSLEKISLLGSNSFLSENKLLKDYNLSKFINAIITYKKTKSNFSDSSSIVPIDLIPKLTKPGYKTNPDYILLCRMTNDELSNVPDFKIYNDYGEVRFLSKVNLINLDIDNECVIEKGSIELNDHLNVKRKCILYNLDLNENEGMIEEFKKKISENNGVFISYNGITGRLEWDYI